MREALPLASSSVSTETGCKGVMRFGKVKAHADQDCRVSRLNDSVSSVLGKPVFSLLVLWAAFWSTHAVVTSNAFAQDTPLASTTSVIQSTIKDNDTYTQAWWSRTHEPSTNGTVRKSEIAPASDRRPGDAVLHGGNRLASRPVTRTCRVGGDVSTEDASANCGAANNPGQIYSKDGSGSPTKGYVDSPRYSLLALGDWLRATTSLGPAALRTPAKDRLFVSDETSLADETPIASENSTAPRAPLLVVHLGSYDLPIALREPQLGDSER